MGRINSRYIRSKIFYFKNFKLHMVEGYIQETPVLEYKDRILIMDGGCRSDVSDIIDYIIYSIKRPIKDIKLVIASHIHPDHAGGIGLYKKLYNFEVAAPEDINRWYGGFLGYVQHKIDISLGHYVASVNRYPFKIMYYPRFVDHDHQLHDGCSIPYFEDWVVYSAKGHTNHDVIFYNKEENILYAADVVLKVKDKFLFPIPVSFPYETKKSVKFLHSLGADKIFLAHGGCVKKEEFEDAYQGLLKLASRLEQGPLADDFLYRLTRITPEVRKANR